MFQQGCSFLLQGVDGPRRVRRTTHLLTYRTITSLEDQPRLVAGGLAEAAGALVRVPLIEEHKNLLGYTFYFADLILFHLGYLFFPFFPAFCAC